MWSLHSSKFCGFFEILQMNIISVNGATVSLVENDHVWEQRVLRERITVWKRSKAGHLGEMTKIFSHVDEVLKDYNFSREVTKLSHCLKDQWARYCFVYNEITSHLPEDTERANEGHQT